MSDNGYSVVYHCEQTNPIIASTFTTSHRRHELTAKDNPFGAKRAAKAEDANAQASPQLLSDKEQQLAENRKFRAVWDGAFDSGPVLSLMEQLQESSRRVQHQLKLDMAAYMRQSEQVLRFRK
ncbi:hypothetical protein RB195_018603 [Necator americanus]|uniref:Uncharacterized protein n=1 Tax=Necator americanus TaxID=51031 RepID=A0ABR1CAH7_NECAM